jgi:hypothetical protein
MYLKLAILTLEGDFDYLHKLEAKEVGTIKSLNVKSAELSI